jgi:hypothetical protein
MTSTRDLSGFPLPASLRRIMQALAMLDAILEEEWADRYFSFNSHWAPGTQMGSMRNGQGDDLFAVFDEAGCFIRGFAHESAMSPWRHTPPGIWPGVLDQVPGQFRESLEEPAFHNADTTFCLWCPAGEHAWRTGAIDYPPEDDPDGSAWMLWYYQDEPEAYSEFARSYFEIDLPVELIARVYGHEPLSPALLQAFGSQRSWQEIATDAAEIGYPLT